MRPTEVHPNRIGQFALSMKKYSDGALVTGVNTVCPPIRSVHHCKSCSYCCDNDDENSDEIDKSNRQYKQQRQRNVPSSERSVVFPNMPKLPHLCTDSPQSCSKPIYDVFLGGSCGNTVWRREKVIPFLEKRAITYYDPQRSVWNENMISEESVAKENSSLFLFVLDPATVNATSFMEIAHFAARKAPKLVVVFLGRSEWKQKGSPDELNDRRRACDLLDSILSRHAVPVLRTIEDALKYIDEVIIGSKDWSEALANPFQRLPFMIVCGKRVMNRTANHVRCAWNKMRSGFSRWHGGPLFIIGICEVLLIFVIHFFLHSIPFLLIVLPMLVMDAFACLFAILYARYKVKAEEKRHITLLQHWTLTGSAPLAVPGRSSVPCNIITQQVQDNVPRSKSSEDGLSVPLWSKLRNGQHYDSFNCYVPTDCYGYDVFLGCSSRTANNLQWISQIAAPLLSRKECSFVSEQMVEVHNRRAALHRARHILYYIPSNDTILSGMVEVAYFLGHSNFQVTLCVPKCAKVSDPSYCQDTELRKHIEMRNECYQMAFCYLKDMADRKKCEIFSDLEDAIHFVISYSKRRSHSSRRIVANDSF
ncbi:hypothetical protein AB6A40_003348 [Gnathostoma spinigerum]|uniref:Uncharacterized protein n=1 Tax=Gnathostoma spinigerum TaxID=75299 RepID=A0ABD6EH27_9BILA